VATEKRLPELANAILDGGSIDWRSAKSSADDTERLLLDQLKLVAAVADFHRHIPAAASVAAPGHWGHLRVLERIGRGAFGEVYRAWDSRLDRDVALKLLPAPSTVGKQRATSIIQEGRLLARVRHPNVVTIYGAERIGNWIGLWMELVHGRTLEEIVTGGRVFSATEVIEIGIELCRAVSAVHTAGLLHRDIKAQNVMVADDGRVVLMDFGTGRELSDAEATPLAGTPLYLAPELLLGREASVRSDIYSLGVLLYRLATRCYPVRGEGLGDLRQAHERHDIRDIRAARPDVPPSLARVIHRALEGRPERRFENATALADALSSVRQPRRWAGRAAFVSLFLAVTLLVSVPAARRTRGTWTGEGSVAVASGTPMRPSVAVVGFSNKTGQRDLDWISAGLSEALTAQLAAGGAVRAIRGDRVAQMKIDFFLVDPDRLIGQHGKRVGAYLGADWIILGSYARPVEGTRQLLRADVRLQRAGTGATLLRVSETSRVTEVSGLATTLGSRIREWLGVSDASSTDAQTARAGLPIDPGAARLYAEAVVLLRRKDVRARKLLEDVVAREPEYPFGHLALYSACAQTMDGECLQRAAQAALIRSTGLSTEERLRIEGTVSGILGDRKKALEAFQTLYAAFPDDVDYGLRLAGEWEVRNKMNEAREVIDQLRALPAPLSDDPRIDLTAARLANDASEHERATERAAVAAEKASAIGARALLARAVLEQAVALHALGDIARSAELLDRAAALSLAEGDRRQAAMTYTMIARARWRSGDTRGAKEAFERAATQFRPNTNDEAGMLRRISEMLLVTEGDLEGIEAVHDRISALLAVEGGLEEKSVRTQVAGSLCVVALALQQRGRLDEARARLDDGRAHVPDGGLHRYDATLMAETARLMIRQGNLVEAHQWSNRALAALRNSPNARRVAALTIHAAVLRARGDLEAAASALDETDTIPLPQRGNLSLRRLGLDEDRTSAADRDVARAELLLSQGRPADAVPLARRSIEVFQFEGNDAAHAYALHVLAQAQIAVGELAAARASLDQAAAMPIARADRFVAVSLAIVSARFEVARASSTDLASARRSLEDARSESSRLGFVMLELEADLAIAEVEIASGARPGARSRLATLERRASSLGAGLIGQRSWALASSNR
jgi:serine/threonine-protein kinase